jgi:hypothetical protein
MEKYLQLMRGGKSTLGQDVRQARLAVLAGWSSHGSLRLFKPILYARTSEESSLRTVRGAITIIPV